MPRYAKKPRTGKVTSSHLSRESEDGNRYKEAISARLESTNDSTSRLVSERAENARLQRMKNEMELAKARGELIEKRLVVAQAGFLMASMRQRILGLPHGWTRKLTGITDSRKMKSQLETMARQLLDDIRQVPRTVDSQWESIVDPETE